jgi:hypothetical protein
MVAPIRVAAAMADAHVAFPDPTNAASIATRVHADAVIVGSVNFFKFSIAVDVRLVRAETGTIDASAHVEGNKDLKILGRDACKALFSSTGAPSHVHQSRDLPASPVLNL